MNPQLELRDIHLPPEPSWWPPAPGWWVLAALLLVAIVLLARRWWRARRERLRRAQLHAEFERAASIKEPVLRLAAVSSLLRRAARVRDPQAAALQGEAWLRFLDGEPVAGGIGRRTDFTQGPGRAFLDAPFRPDTDEFIAGAAIEPARARFLQLLDAA